MKRYFSSCLLIMCAIDAQAVPSAFEQKTIYASGAANIAPAFGGEYVYKTAPTDGRAKIPAMLTGPVERPTFEFFSLEEEIALLQFKNTQSAAMTKKIDRKALVKHPTYSAQASQAHHWIWPKVVVRDTEICVPHLADSESADWKNHLTCFHGRDDQ